MKILLTDGDYGHCVAAARDLRSSGHQVHALGRRTAPASFSNAVHKSHVLKPDDLRAQRILDLCRENNLEGVIPVGIESVLAVDSVRSELSGFTSFAVPPQNALTKSKDKFLLQEFASDLKIPIPSSILVSSLDELNRHLDEATFPFVLKSVSHLCPWRPLYVRTEGQKTELLNSNSANPYFLFGAVQIQRMVDGPGEGFFALYQNGQCVRMMTHERLMEYPPSGGSSWLATSTEKDDIRLMGMSLLDALEWHGPAMVEFKRSKDAGTPYLMELNPKLWGSLALSIASGMRVPADIARLIAGERLVPDFSYTSGILFWWPFNSPEALFGGFKALSHGQPKTNLRWFDFAPHLVELITMLLRVGSQLFILRDLGRWLGWVLRLGSRAAAERFSGEVLGIPTRKASEVSKFLWVGAKPKLVGRAYLRYVERRSILSLLERDPRESDHKLRNHIHFPLPEYVDIDPSTLIRLAETMEDIRAQGKRVFVHCREGVGRAPTAAVAYLMCTGVPKLEALALVEQGRRVTALSELQKNSINQLDAFLSQRD